MGGIPEGFWISLERKSYRGGSGNRRLTGNCRARLGIGASREGTSREELVENTEWNITIVVTILINSGSSNFRIFVAREALAVFIVNLNQ